jgi:hypothetical protein
MIYLLLAVIAGVAVHIAVSIVAPPKTSGPAKSIASSLLIIAMIAIAHMVSRDFS